MFISSSKQPLNALRVFVPVMLLTLGTFFQGCSYVERRYAEECKTRAFLDSNISDFITRRFDSKAPVRMAIIPYSTPANLATGQREVAPLGDDFVWKLHAELLGAGELPIVEVFNRQDWPGKREEFYTGNFGALALAREAGYDLVLVGITEPMKSTELMVVRTKVLEVDSGVTLYYAQDSVFTRRPDRDSLMDTLAIESRKPSTMYTGILTEKLAQCVVRNLKNAGY